MRAISSEGKFRTFAPKDYSVGKFISQVIKGAKLCRAEMRN